MKRDQRTAIAERGALVSVWSLLGLTLFKGAAGWLTGSKALLADACHSAADCAASFQTYKGLHHFRKKPSDGRASESAASIFLSALLLVAGLEMGISSIRSLTSGPDHAPGWEAAALIAAGMIVREMLIRHKRRRDSLLGLRGERTEEPRTDMLASLTALIGASATASGEMLDLPILYVMDPAAGLVISAFVLRKGCRLIALSQARSGRLELGEAEAQLLLETVQRIDGVIAVDDLHTREHGHYIVVNVNIRVNPRISVAEGHDIAQRVRRHLTKRFLHVSDVSVQVQPFDAGYPYKSNHQDQEWSSVLQ
ncbi:cation diffusion facilitator family transporter [Cohnella pontilimi]|uniref:cation diffusion facilitator family transporter n=1 Tax=Cohnella pontilimi TaxID=2564100 RepID=UPI00145ED01F|nr:cation diffusion facilitator family transporter [Cohnella pontilimi]